MASIKLPKRRGWGNWHGPDQASIEPDRALLLPEHPLSAPELVSVLVPCRNEERFISRCLESILACDYPYDRIEVLVIDGQSDDHSRELVASSVARDPRVRLIDNPGQIAATGLNIGLRTARGSIIMRMDAHAVYPPNYISVLVRWLAATDASNVGAPWMTCAGGRSRRADAIALALTHPLAVGNAHYRLGVQSPRWVDTVPFGCFRRELFDRIGYFDENVGRNEDDEFNRRIVQHGGGILLVPDVVVQYYARSRIRELWNTYFQYGLFKPLVLRKRGGVYNTRQAAPPLLVTTLATSAVLACFSTTAAYLSVCLILTYLALISLTCIALARCSTVASLPILMLIFPTIHCAYGSGFIAGVWWFVLMRRPWVADLALLPLTRHW
jgi:cellulose synthase/poly-beta-1,6-N-acetylglucosamine synthase-like glycosyltransferase